MNEDERHVYFSMHQKSDMIYNPHDEPITPCHLRMSVTRLIYRIVVKENLPSPYDTQCKRHSVNGKLITSNECYQSCYSSFLMKKHKLFPFDSPRILSVENGSFASTSLSQANAATREEDLKRKCSSRCGEDCYQVTYYMRQPGLTMEKIEKRKFVIRGPEEVIVISYSAKHSFWDLMSLLLNGASFYFSFCPASFLLSDWFYSRILRRTILLLRFFKSSRKPANDIREAGVITHLFAILRINYYVSSSLVLQPKSIDYLVI